eukprot:1257686-Rhodomonas_salina.1
MGKRKREREGQEHTEKKKIKHVRETHPSEPRALPQASPSLPAGPRAPSGPPATDNSPSQTPGQTCVDTRRQPTTKKKTFFSAQNDVALAGFCVRRCTVVDEPADSAKA